MELKEECHKNRDELSQCQHELSAEQEKCIQQNITIEEQQQARKSSRIFLVAGRLNFPYLHIGAQDTEKACRSLGVCCHSTRRETERARANAHSVIPGESYLEQHYMRKEE